MWSPFRHSNTPVVVNDPAPRPAQVVAVDGPVAKGRLRDAYEKGRIDERGRHHGSPVLVFLLAVVALIGAVFLYYAYREGSFAGGGAVVDNKIEQVTAPAVQKAGDAVENAGDNLKSQGQAIKQAAPAAPPPSNSQ